MSKRKLNFIDIFSGCGGIAQGFVDANYDFLIGVDNDKPSLETLKYNFPKVIPINCDLSSEKSLNEIIKAIPDSQLNLFQPSKEKSVDVIVGGPPCQGFSLTGPRKFDDPRNKLYLSFINLINKVRPKAFVVENVPGIKSLYNGEIFEEIIKRYEKTKHRI